jgi:MFS family permease
MIALSFSVGLTGAIFGGRPVSIILERYDWHDVALFLGIVSIVIGIFSYLILRSPCDSIGSLDRMKAKDTFKLQDLITLLSSKSVWIMSLSGLLMVGALEGFADVWGVSYLTAAYGLDKQEAAQLTSLIFCGMLVGGPLLVALTSRFGNYFVITGCGVLIGCLFVFLLFNSHYDPYLFSLGFFLIGVACCYQVPIFAASADIVSPKYLGVMIALINCVNMLGGSFFHSAIGYLMDRLGTASLDANGVRIYEITSYRYGLSTIPICAFLGSLLILRIKRTASQKIA